MTTTESVTAVYEEEIDDERMTDFGSDTYSYKEGFVRVQPYNAIYPRGYTKYDERIKRANVFDDDVWIATYPRSGTRWMQELVWLLKNNLDYEKASTTSLALRAPFFDYAFILPNSVSQDLDSIEVVNRMPTPRVINTHLSYDMLPRKLHGNTNAKIVAVIRNPRDVCCSLLNHFRIINKYTGTMETLTNAFLADVAPYYGPYFVHTLSYWNQQRNHSNIFIAWYEEMQSDLPAVIRKLAKFLDVSILDEDISKLCKHLSFDNMKKNPMVNMEEAIQAMKQKQNNTMEGSMIHKGKTGRWKEIFNEETVKRFEEWEAKGLKDSDMKLVFEV